MLEGILKLQVDPRLGIILEISVKVELLVDIYAKLALILKYGKLVTNSENHQYFQLINF